MSLDSVRNDSKDLQTILSKIGNVAGCVKIFNIDTVMQDIKNDFLNEIKNAKGIWIDFEILPKTSILTLVSIMDFISKDVDEDCEIIFETISNENIPENSVKCRILFTGLN